MATVTASITDADPSFDHDTCLGSSSAFLEWMVRRNLIDYLRFGNVAQEEEYLVWQYENVEGMARARRWWIAWHLKRTGRWMRPSRNKPWQRIRPPAVAISGEIEVAS
jgi:hypothetical protein